MTPPSDRSEPWPRAIGCALTGQDTALATFSHRHSVRHDWEDGGTCIPLAHIAPDQASVEIYNGPLSEVGVLGFEDGYSLDRPDGLTHAQRWPRRCGRPRSPWTTTRCTSEA